MRQAAGHLRRPPCGVRRCRSARPRGGGNDTPVTGRRRVLFTGGGGAASEAFQRLLAGAWEVHFADADAEAKPAIVSPSFWHTIPFAAAAGFVDELRRLCRETQIDVLVPGVDEELVAIAEADPPVAPHVLLPPPSFIARHLDKLASNASLRSLGVPVPETAGLAEGRRVAFPCVAKPRRGRGSRHVAIVRSEAELNAHVLLSHRPARDFIVQERLEGPEYTVLMVADRSARLRAVVPVRVEIKRGITIRAETDRDAAVISACAAIHKAQPVSGCYNVQAIKTAADVVQPFEINPRISTTTCLAVAAGVDFLGLALDDDQRVVGATASADLVSFHNGFRLKRSWNNEFISPTHG